MNIAPRTRTGSYVLTPGSALDEGDYVFDRVTQRWYVLGEQVDGTRYTRVFRGQAEDGKVRRILLDSSTVKAYRWER